MSKTRYHIKSASRRKLPVIPFTALWLLMDRLQSPQWLWGIFWFSAALISISFIYDLIKYDNEDVDLQKFLKQTHVRGKREKEEE